MTAPTPRIHEYYNALVGRGRHVVAPTISEARRDLRRATEAELHFHGI